MKNLIVGIALILIASTGAASCTVEADQPKSGAKTAQPKAADAKGNMAEKGNLELATIAGGCFWCLEAVFDELKGVESAESGYTGGTVPNPTYKQVCNGDTGHAEVVQIAFDPNVVSYKDILKVFFTIHDPTTLDRQGADVGTQYRSAIFYHSPEQKAVAEEVIREITDQKIWDAPIVTEVTPLEKYYVAEDYHQEYFARNPTQGYCSFIIAPKVAKFREKFFDKLKKN